MVHTIKRTLKEYGRGIIGGLIFSLPLIYTMEVWWAGFIAPPGYLLSAILVTFLLLLGYNRYAGMRKDSTFWEVCWDSVEEIGLAFIVSFLFLLLIDRINFEMSLDEIAGKVIVESMIVAIGISIGTAQLGQNDDDDDDDSGMDGDSKEGENAENGLIKTMILSICGAVLFASSVAPTEEILMIAVEAQTAHLLLMVFLSLILSSIILYFSDFKGSKTKDIGIKKMILHISIGYVIALAVSFAFLLFFGRTDGNSFEIVLAQMIVLALPGTIGASAGRLLIDGK
ncbi:MAG TPA: TIGR02587 family membrane protein [Salinimicrobium sp.]|nr:TIGR02587 family membrane protein [Salinimicrobium sp.]